MAVPLEVRAATKRYQLGASELEVLRGVDLVVASGELCAVMGPSGVGKSTLLSCAAGLDLIDGGSLQVFGEELGAMSEDQRTILRRRRIGVVYQFFNLVPNLSVAENVALPYLIDGTEPDERVIAEALDRVGMSGRADHRPAQLSGGEMQLASIARALVRKPGLILADEPTGNVNVATGKRIMALLAEVVAETGCAMLLVTHNPRDAACAERAVFMTDGRIDPAHELTGDFDADAVHHALSELGI